MLKDQTTGWTYEWKRQGMIQRSRDDIVDILMTRFDSAPKDFPQDIIEVLQSIDDDSYINAWIQVVSATNRSEER